MSVFSTRTLQRRVGQRLWQPSSDLASSAAMACIRDSVRLSCTPSVQSTSTSPSPRVPVT